MVLLFSSFSKNERFFLLYWSHLAVVNSQTMNNTHHDSPNPISFLTKPKYEIIILIILMEDPEMQPILEFLGLK